MQIVVTTFLGLALAALVFFVRPHHRLAVIGIGLPFGAAAVVNLPALGNSSVTIPNFVAAVLIGLFLLRKDALPRLLAVCRPYQPGFFLVMFIGFGLAVTVLSPRLFSGSIEVFSLARGGNVVGGTALVPLSPSPANVTQGLYLLEGVIFFLVIVAMCHRGDGLRFVANGIQAITVTHLLLTVANMMENALGTDLLLGWLRTANYAFLNHAVFAGLPRLVGGFPEASTFGSFTSALLAFWLIYWRHGGGIRWSPLYIVALTAALILSTSSGAYVAFAGFLLIVGPLMAYDVARRRATSQATLLVATGLLLSPVAIGAFFLALEVSPGFYSYMDYLIFSKLESDSGVERSAWNRQALQAFWDSYLVGAGLGSVRGSSFVTSTLATVGVVGAALFAAFFVTLVQARTPMMHSEYRSFVGGAKAACLALFLNASLSAPSPDLGLPFFLFAAVVVAFSEQRLSQRSSMWQHTTQPEPRLARGRPPGG